jgi:hypothetical protein
MRTNLSINTRTSPLLYHGSPSVFNDFDYRRIGANGTTEGFGFYFTDEKRIAEKYGQKGCIFEVFLHGNALSGNKTTMTKAEYGKLISYLDEQEDYLSNYGEKDYEGYQTVLKRALNDYYQCNSDSELIGSLVNSSGSAELILTAIYQLLGYGYLIDYETIWGDEQNVYVAFTNDVIEIVNANKQAII